MTCSRLFEVSYDNHTHLTLVLVSRTDPEHIFLKTTTASPVHSSSPSSLCQPVLIPFWVGTRWPQVPVWVPSLEKIRTWTKTFHILYILTTTRVLDSRVFHPFWSDSPVMIEQRTCLHTDDPRKQPAKNLLPSWTQIAASRMPLLMYNSAISRWYLGPMGARHREATRRF